MYVARVYMDDLNDGLIVDDSTRPKCGFLPFLFNFFLALG